MQDYSKNTTISLFIFSSNIYGMQYGMGTYINELSKALLLFPDIEIFIVAYTNSENNEFSVVEKSNRFYEIVIPKLSCITEKEGYYYSKKYANSVVYLISEFIPKTGKVIFLFNCNDDLSIMLRLRKLYDHPQINIVHYALWQQIFGSNKGKLRGCNIDNPNSNIEISLSKERDRYRQSDHIVSVTNYMKEFLIDEYKIKEEKISVINNGLNCINHSRVTEKEKFEIKKKLGFGEDETIILFSGRIDPCKGVFFLIEAFERACRKNSGLRLVMLGQGNIQDCQKRMHSSFGKVTYPGFLSKETLTLFYKIADIGISPSLYDHCPYSVLEMIANKIPLIISRIEGLDELLSEDECFFINPVISKEEDISFNIEELSELILTVSSDKGLRTKLAENSYKTFESRFLAASMAKKMHNLFYSLKKSMTEYEIS